MPDDMPLREATLDDVPTLVNHRRRMFEEMDALRGKVHEPAMLDAMGVAYALYLRGCIADGRLRAWVIEAGGRIVASGAVSFLDWPPRPDDLGQRLALLHSVYTEHSHRRLGLARRIVECAIDACRSAGLKRLSLHASDAGRRLYESMNFKPTNEMRLAL